MNDTANTPPLPSNKALNMTYPVYIGLALTSHNTDPTVACEATFSDVTSSGTGSWANQDIGIISNDTEQMYVSLESGAQVGIVEHPDPNAAVLAGVGYRYGRLYCG